LRTVNPRNNQVELLGIPELERTLSRIQRDVFPTANARALNHAGARIRTIQVRAIAATMGVQQKDVRSRVVLTRARKNRQQALVEYTGRALNLEHFKARQTRKGVTASPWGKRRLFAHAFIATMPQGGRVVVIRQKGANGRLVPRMPIRAMLGPGIAKTAGDPHLEAQRADILRDDYPAELTRQLDLLVQQVLARETRART